MKGDRFVWFVFGFCLASFLWASTIHAYEFNGEKWTSTLNWYMGDGCNLLVEPMAKEILEEISPVDHVFKGEYSGVGRDGRSVIYCSDKPEPLSDVSDLQMSESFILSSSGAVVGNTRWWHGGGRIYEMDIWLHEDVLYNLSKIITHELLHGFGLQHSLDPRAIMFWQPSSNDPYIDDLAGISMLYDCEVKADQDANIFIPSVEWLGQDFSAFMMLEDGGYMPYDVAEGC